MIYSSKNSIGDVSGDHNQIIQVTLSNGEEITEKLGILIGQLVIHEKKEIETLEALITAKMETIKDKVEIITLKDNEIVQLKTTLVEKQKQLDQNEERFATLLVENNGKDFTGSQELYPKAVAALMKGNREEAFSILTRQALFEEKKKLDIEKQQQADAWLLRADLLKSEDVWDEELNECYELAVETLSNWNTNLDAGNHFQFINDFTRANEYYQACLLKATTEEDKAATLNNLAILQRNINEYEKAEASYEKSLIIYRKLVIKNPQIYLQYVGTILNNLAILQRTKNEYKNAESFFEEALSIRRELVRLNSQAYLPDLATSLNNLAILFYDKNNYKKAESYFKEALSIRRKLAKLNPKVYLPDLATTLNNLGNLQRITNEYEKAECSLEEALSIRRALAVRNPQTYTSYVATTLNNLATLYRVKKEYEKAEASYEETLKIQYALADTNSQTFLPYIAGSLNNLGNLQRDKNEYEKAERSYEKALSIQRLLVASNPQIYLPDIGMTLINMGLFYQDSKIDKELSIKLANEAITLLLPFSEIGYIQNYLKEAFLILENWHINVKADWEEEMKFLDIQEEE